MPDTANRQNALYFGDNLYVLREHVPAESVDLVYLDPPFNSKAAYNVLFKTPKGHESDAQITAFEDTWHWGAQAESEYGELLGGTNTNVPSLSARSARSLARTT
jgi:16S rRNA G966 N2-methylase RsmD